LTDGFSVGTGTASVELDVGVSVVTGFGIFVGSSEGDDALFLGADEGSADGLEFSAGESEFPAVVGAETGVESPSSCFSAFAAPTTLVSPPSVLKLDFFEMVFVDCGSLTRLSSLSFFAHTRERTHSTMNARNMRISV